MTQSIKISGLIELEIELPDGLTMPLALNLPGQPGPEPQSQSAFPDTANGRIAERIAAYIRDAGPAGRTRREISQRFREIKNGPQRDAVLRLLPDLLYRRTKDTPTGRGSPAERWTYHYAEEGTAE